MSSSAPPLPGTGGEQAATFPSLIRSGGKPSSVTSGKGLFDDDDIPLDGIIFFHFFNLLSLIFSFVLLGLRRLQNLLGSRPNRHLQWGAQKIGVFSRTAALVTSSGASRKTPSRVSSVALVRANARRLDDLELRRTTHSAPSSPRAPRERAPRKRAPVRGARSPTPAHTSPLRSTPSVQRTKNIEIAKVLVAVCVARHIDLLHTHEKPLSLESTNDGDFFIGGYHPSSTDKPTTKRSVKCARFLPT